MLCFWRLGSSSSQRHHHDGRVGMNTTLPPMWELTCLTETHQFGAPRKKGAMRLSVGLIDRARGKQGGSLDTPAAKHCMVVHRLPTPLLLRAAHLPMATALGGLACLTGHLGESCAFRDDVKAGSLNMGGRRGSCRRQHAPTEDEHVMSRARPSPSACCLTGRRHVSGGCWDRGSKVSHQV